MTRVSFESGTEVAVGPILLGADVSRGRFGSGADLSDYQFMSRINFMLS